VKHSSIVKVGMLMLDGESSTVFRWMGVYQKSEGEGVIFALQLQSIGILGCPIPIHVFIL
jgi:hypothetical protein